MPSNRIPPYSLNNATSSSKEQEQEQGTQTDICSPSHLPACSEHCRAAQVTRKAAGFSTWRLPLLLLLLLLLLLRMNVGLIAIELSRAGAISERQESCAWAWASARLRWSSSEGEERSYLTSVNTLLLIVRGRCCKCTTVINRMRAASLAISSLPAYFLSTPMVAFRRVCERRAPHASHVNIVHRTNVHRTWCVVRP